MNPDLLVSEDRPETIEGNFSKIFKQIEPGKWRHIAPEPYKKETRSYKGVTRYELVGKRGESTAFHTRYFEIEKDGYSSYERHEHEHVVVVMRGSGEVRLGCRYIALGKGDVIYVSPQDAHQFLNRDSDEPFGFLCTVHAVRDRPVAVDGNEYCEICE